MKTIALTFTLMLALLTACEQDTYTLPEATPSFLLTTGDYKKWEMIDPTVALDIGSATPIIMPACASSEVKNGLGYFYNIYASGRLDLQDGCGKTATDRVLLTGTWTFGADQKTVTATLPGMAVQSWAIKQLTVSRLTITVEGKDLTFAPTPLRN